MIDVLRRLQRGVNLHFRPHRVNRRGRNEFTLSLNYVF